jgi:predicted transcriptional regulator
MHRPVLFSLHPRWAELVFAGAKTIEVRRRFLAPTAAPTLAYVHQTGANGGLVGSVVLSSVSKERLETLRGPLAARTCIPTELLDGYLAGRDHGIAIALKRPVRFQEPMPLAAMRSLGLQPPQLFTWIDAPAQDVLHAQPVVTPQGRVCAFVSVDLASLPIDHPVFARPRALYAPGFDGWLAAAAAANRPTWGLEVDGALRALAICAPRPDGSVKLCTFLCLEEGMGGFLLARLLATLGGQGARGVYGEVLASETHTRAFFERAGFTSSDAPGKPGSLRISTSLL